MSWMNSKIGANDSVYTPVNAHKFISKTGQAVCRSSWERIFCQWADHNDAVIQWASEPIAIPYMDKTKKDNKGLPKKRHYYPDFLLKIRNSSGVEEIWLVEIKPKKETMPPKPSSRKKKSTLIQENNTWMVNEAKWKSAISYCQKRGWRFKILTEDHLIK